MSNPMTACDSGPSIDPLKNQPVPFQGLYFPSVTYLDKDSLHSARA